MLVPLFAIYPGDEAQQLVIDAPGAMISGLQMQEQVGPRPE